ncbi:ABC transporter ATP-binding protein [Thermocladium modestius]|uniref:ABC transporter ATP-binding protein n=1 Tax=Thermocladium modestius TaxID=62609 RepID=A0A830GWI4_9CREN|nr:ABC transporter ATP-binding protein [Thermocladium modestius]
MSTKLETRDLHVSVDGKEILSGIDLSVGGGEVVALMGPNGSGKTTLFMALMGHPRYSITRGSILLNGIDITKAPPEERSILGIMMAFQNPVPVPEVRLTTLITAMVNKRMNRKITDSPPPQVVAELVKSVGDVGLTQSHLSRGANHGFSGGEAKRSEVLQLLMAKPKVALLDEPDSGLDVDGVAAVGKAVSKLAERGTAVLLTTHQARILHYVSPKRVLVLKGGKIATQGGLELVEEIEKMGYEAFLRR